MCRTYNCIAPETNIKIFPLGPGPKTVWSRRIWKLLYPPNFWALVAKEVIMLWYRSLISILVILLISTCLLYLKDNNAVILTLLITVAIATRAFSFNHSAFLTYNEWRLASNRAIFYQKINSKLWLDIR